MIKHVCAPRWWRLLLLSAHLLVYDATAVAAETQVLAEEIVTRFVSANNGAGPLWCYGSPLLVRDRTGVYVSVIETGEQVEPLCNTRWQIWRRQDAGWRVLCMEGDYRQREPCPLVTLQDKGLLLSANPSVTERGTFYRACRPTVFVVTDRELPSVLGALPRWSGEAHFNDHSYRGLAADGRRGEALLLNIDTKTSEQWVSWRDTVGTWQPRGRIAFPIRAAYPQVALRDGAASVMAIGDIQEPNPEWRQLKADVLKQDWDYVFRRLFYTSTRDLAQAPFSIPIEVDSVETTAGNILNLDLHIDQRGFAHLLYLRQAHQYAFIRDRYFPGASLGRELCHVVMKDDQLLKREILARSPEDDGDGLDPHFARFHVGPAEQLWVVMAGQRRRDGEIAFVNLVHRVDATINDGIELPLRHPFHRFFNAVPRGGCEPSEFLDLFGVSDDSPNLRYACVQLASP